MPKPTPPQAEELFEEPTLDEAPFEEASPIEDESPPPEDGDRTPVPRSPFPTLKVVAALVAVLALGGSLLAYRSHLRRKALDAGMARAEELIRLDTAAGYREASSLLEPLVELDPLEAASLRAFALAMLFADYRDGRAEAEAEALLVRPGRAAEIPARASLAVAALGLGRRSLGDATTAASAAQGSPWSGVLQARIALAAGSVSAAVEPAAAAAADPRLPAGLALQGDVTRRAQREPAVARAAYAAALAASPSHPRATYGLAKLALAGDLPPAEAIGPLQRLAGDAAGTPAPERGRAALHLAALRLRAGDRAGASAALDGASLDASARSWAERAAAVEAAHRGSYRAVSGAPAALQSASDDDPPELPAAPPIEPRPQPPPASPARAAAKHRAAAAKAPAARKAPAHSAKPKGTAAKKPAAKAASSHKKPVRPPVKKAAQPR